jgi:hypothetical protein
MRQDGKQDQPSRILEKLASIIELDSFIVSDLGLINMPSL